MIKEDYVSFEVAKLLKEKGFDEDIDLWYDENGEMFGHPKYDICRNWRVRQGMEIYQCSTLQMAMKWMREEHHLYVWISYNFNHTGLPWYYEIFDIKNRKVVKIGGVECGSYEKTCEIAIEECLKNLI